MNVLLIDAKENRSLWITVSGKISEYCDLIGTDNLATDLREIGGRKYEIMFDPAAVGSDSENVTAIDENENEVFFGSILVFAPGENGLSTEYSMHSRSDFGILSDRMGSILKPEMEIGRQVLVLDSV